MVGKLEENLKKIDEMEKELELVTIFIDKYNNSDDPAKINNFKNLYETNLKRRDTLTISLNYYQGKVIIEKDNEILKYLKELKK